MCCGKPIIAVTAMQENHKIELHNHNEYPLLYKEAEISALSLGRFLECRRCNTGTCALPDMSALTLGLVHTYQPMHSVPVLQLSLSTVVLNSRDWWEIIWLTENFAL